MPHEINIKDAYALITRILTLAEGEEIDLGAFKIFHLKDNMFKVVIENENIEHVIEKLMGNK